MTDGYVLYFVSLGCAKNLVETETLLARFAEKGFVISSEPEWADVIVINTCGFLRSAQQEAREVINALKGYRQSGRCRCLAVIGCWSQIDHDRILDEFPEVDIVAGVNGRSQFADVVEEYLENSEDRLIYLPPVNTCWDSTETVRLRLTPRHWAYLRISEGCSQRCSFCMIPAIRGRYRSKPLRSIIEEAKALVDDGVKELILIGQETTSWGRDFHPRKKLADLLYELNKLEGIDWIRLMYTYPSNFDTDLIDAIAGLDKVVKYVDLPLQHINDDILRLMERGVSRAYIEDLLFRLREKVHDIAIRTTMIVGFPTEGEEEFSELLDFVKSFRFDELGAFMYSAEEGTRAASFPNQVDDETKLRRWRRLMELQRKVVKEKSEELLGKKMWVYVEDVMPRRKYISSRSERQAPEVDSLTLISKASFSGKLPVSGDKLLVKVVSKRGYDLIAEKVMHH